MKSHDEDGYQIGRWLVREDWPLWVLLTGCLGVGLALYPVLPDTIPTHWDLRGEVNGWSSRAYGVFGSLGIAIAAYLGMVLLPLVDPLRRAYVSFPSAYRVIRWAVILVFLGSWVASILLARGTPVRTGMLMPLGAGALFIVIGNVLPRLRRNWFVGIKTPWSMSNDEAWRRTHRAAGPAWVVGGLVAVLGALIGGSLSTLATVVGLGGATVFSVAWSYVAYRQSLTPLGIATSDAGPPQSPDVTEQNREP